MWVRGQIDSLFTPDEIYAHGGLVVRTTLNLDWQHHAERAITLQLEALRQRNESGLDHNLNNAALVALDPHSGEILAMVGSPDYFDADHAGAVNMAIAPRQPGSALKPLIYAAAFDPQVRDAKRDPTNPQPFTPASMLLDVSTNFLTHDGKPYTPVNYDGVEHGPVLIRDALASSLNIPAVLTLNHIGLPALFKTAQALGITTLGDPDLYDLSLALGGGEVSLLELSGAYGAFANGGLRVTPNAILEVQDPQGRTLYRAPAMPAVRVLDERVAWLISDILSDDDARVTGFGRNSMLRLDRPAAVKTGTTTDFHDNWTIGYTPSLVVGVWAGNASHEAMRDITGLTGAAPVWHQFIRTVLEGQPEQPFIQPPGLVKVEVCRLSGMLPTPACPYRRAEWFIDGAQPRSPDTIYREVTIDRATGRLADDSTPPDRRVVQVVLDLPPQAQPWAHTHHLALLSDLLSGGIQPTSGAGVTDPALPLSLVSPPNGAIYQLSAGFDANAQSLRLAAVGEAGLGPVTFFIDGNPVATLAAPPYETWWPLAPGVHEVWAEARRSNGELVTSSRVRFEVH
jgi:membrane carboxypeptidase/penicillin-binding protein PbpC